jgi:hypothetical protein
MLRIVVHPRAETEAEVLKAVDSVNREQRHKAAHRSVQEPQHHPKHLEYTEESTYYSVFNREPQARSHSPTS